MIQYLISDVKFVQFQEIICPELYDMILAKLMIDKIARLIICVRETITEEDDHSSKEPEQSDIQIIDSEWDPVEQRNEPEQSDIQIGYVKHLYIVTQGLGLETGYTCNVVRGLLIFLFICYYFRKR